MVKQIQQTKSKIIKQTENINNSKIIKQHIVINNIKNYGISGSTSQSNSSIFSKLEKVLHLNSNNNLEEMKTNHQLNEGFSSDNIEEEEFEEESSEISPLQQLETFQYDEINTNYIIDEC